jgi:mRNA-degrading endonuclease RelE of RelBE toxin-antitoxin system
VEIRYSMSAQRALRRSDKRELIRRKIEQLAVDSKSLGGNIKKLQGRPEFRLRVQDWRVIFLIEDNVLHVEEIEPRGSIY